jgi:hypothetical protein
MQIKGFAQPSRIPSFAPAVMLPPLSVSLHHLLDVFRDMTGLLRLMIRSATIAAVY